jgi:hypothetical protein
MTDVTKAHELKETLSIDVMTPGHDPRIATSLFVKSRKHLIERDKCCFICGENEQESGAPLEAHHFPIERSFAEGVDWSLVKKDFPNFAWGSFDESNPYFFVDDMNVNGMLLCRNHHIAKDMGIHDMPLPLWVAQKYMKEGYQFSSIEVIHHEQN